MKWNNRHNGIFKIVSQLFDAIIYNYNSYSFLHMCGSQQTGLFLPSTHVVLISKPYKAKLSQGYKGPWWQSNGIVTTLFGAGILIHYPIHRSKTALSYISKES